MLDRPGDSGIPGQRIGAIKLSGSVFKSKFQHASKSTFPATHSLIPAWSHNLVSPPARSHLCKQDVPVALGQIEGIGNVICKGIPCLGVVGVAGFENFLSHSLAIDIELIYTKPRCHPLDRTDLRRKLIFSHKARCTISRTIVPAVIDLPLYDRCVSNRDPLRAFPRRIIQCINTLPAHLGRCAGKHGKSAKGQRNEKESHNQSIILPRMLPLRCRYDHYPSGQQ